MKKIISILTILVLFLGSVCLLTGCGNNKEESKNQNQKNETTAENSKSTSYGWYEVEVPEGYEAKDDGSEFVVKTEYGSMISKIKVNKSSSSITNAEKKYKEGIGKYNQKDAGSEKIGDYTWYMLSFKFNDKDSVVYYTQIDEKNYIEINAFCLEKGNKVVNDFLKSLKVNVNEL